MKSLLRYTIQPLHRLWLRWTYDDPYKIRLAQCRAGDPGWITRWYRIEFHRPDYDIIREACRVRNQSTIRFLEEAALERAKSILQTEDSGRHQ
jgi:hypothetical protein